MRKKLEGLTALGYNPALEVAKLDMTIQIKALEHEQEQRSQSSSGMREVLLDRAADPGYWRRLDSAERRTLFHWLVDRVEVTPDPQAIVVKLNV